jgi:hypothetical protein
MCGLFQVAGDFTLAMQALVGMLGASQCSYVRCVKPNAKMQPGLFENQYVVTQVRGRGGGGTTWGDRWKGAPTRAASPTLTREGFWAEPRSKELEDAPFF